VTVVNIVSVPVPIQSKPGAVFRPDAKSARAPAADAVGPTSPAQTRGAAFTVLRDERDNGELVSSCLVPLLQLQSCIHGLNPE
jgi:hypothetical protein